MTATEDWGALVPELEKWADVVAIGPGRLAVTADDVTRELVLTPSQWDDIESAIFGGDAAGAARLVRDAWDRATTDELFLVYDRQYDVQPSLTPTLPDPFADFRAVVERARAENPDGEFGWYAYPPENSTAED